MAMGQLGLVRAFPRAADPRISLVVSVFEIEVHLQQPASVSAYVILDLGVQPSKQLTSTDIVRSNINTQLNRHPHLHGLKQTQHTHLTSLSMEKSFIDMERLPPPAPSHRCSPRPLASRRRYSLLVRSSLLAFCACLTIFILFHRTPKISTLDWSPWQEEANTNTCGVDSCSPRSASSSAAAAVRIPLEAHIMSKCPDARHCLKYLVVPAMEEVSDKVNFRLSFIGK
jgi:hypothetical protein